MGRPGQPAELAAVHVLLAPVESRYATGQVYGAAAMAGLEPWRFGPACRRTRLERLRSAALFNINRAPTQAQDGLNIINLDFGIREKKDKDKLSVPINNLLGKQYAIADPGIMLNAKGIASTAWGPARDAFRYDDVRFDMKF